MEQMHNMMAHSPTAMGHVPSQTWAIARGVGAQRGAFACPLSSQSTLSVFDDDTLNPAGHDRNTLSVLRNTIEAAHELLVSSNTAPT